jgi:hypothetical protein
MREHHHGYNHEHQHEEEAPDHDALALGWRHASLSTRTSRAISVYPRRNLTLEWPLEQVNATTYLPMPPS